VIKKDGKYVTTLSTVLYTDIQTIVLLKKEVMTILSNAGGQAERYTITIPMENTFPHGTQFTDIISCNKFKVASTGDSVITIVKGMPQVFQVPR
jgi:hypothetical protein